MPLSVKVFNCPFIPCFPCAVVTLIYVPVTIFTSITLLFLLYLSLSHTTSQPFSFHITAYICKTCLVFFYLFHENFISRTCHFNFLCTLYFLSQTCHFFLQMHEDDLNTDPNGSFHQTKWKIYKEIILCFWDLYSFVLKRFLLNGRCFLSYCCLHFF